MQQIQPLSPFHRPVTLCPRFYHTIVNPLNIISFSSSPPPISSRRLRKFFPRKILKEPSKPSLKRLTSRIVELTRRRQLLQIFEEVEKAKKLYGQLNTIVMNAVMQGCVHCGDIDSALRVFEEMSKLESCGVDNVTYGTLVKNTLPQAQNAAVSSTLSNARKEVVQKSSPGPSRHSPIVKNQNSKVVSSKPAEQSAGGYDTKLVEMVNSVIVDRSPSVKWEDIGEKLQHILFPS
ncbi:unnamed protein product [Ilex paraguariensis]|uniref:Pentatricopeptide repeat-containing protein n=1 Tax=Ilex paraguariensis TaxID=185542 RepID=A0ABC8SBP6_9AQUA